MQSFLHTKKEHMCSITSAAWIVMAKNMKEPKLELDMEKQSGSNSGKEYVKAVYCHPDLTSMQSTS